LVDAPITAGTIVRLECVDCPRREEDAQLGRVTRISLHGRLWSRAEWEPRHLTDASRTGWALGKPRNTIGLDTPGTSVKMRENGNRVSQVPRD
jgi:hypothetical protein